MLVVPTVVMIERIARPDNAVMHVADWPPLFHITQATSRPFTVDAASSTLPASYTLLSVRVA